MLHVKEIYVVIDLCHSIFVNCVYVSCLELTDLEITKLTGCEFLFSNIKKKKTPTKR